MNTTNTHCSELQYDLVNYLGDYLALSSSTEERSGVMSPRREEPNQEHEVCHTELNNEEKNKRDGYDH